VIGGLVSVRALSALRAPKLCPVKLAPRPVSVGLARTLDPPESVTCWEKGLSVVENALRYSLPTLINNPGTRIWKLGSEITRLSVPVLAVVELTVMEKDVELIYVAVYVPSTKATPVVV
jgi:hypothetical protein